MGALSMASVMSSVPMVARTTATAAMGLEAVANVRETTLAWTVRAVRATNCSVVTKRRSARITSVMAGHPGRANITTIRAQVTMTLVVMEVGTGSMLTTRMGMGL